MFNCLYTVTIESDNEFTILGILQKDVGIVYNRLTISDFGISIHGLDIGIRNENCTLILV